MGEISNSGSPASLRISKRVLPARSIARSISSVCHTYATKASGSLPIPGPRTSPRRDDHAWHPEKRARAIDRPGKTRVTTLNDTEERKVQLSQYGVLGLRLLIKRA